MSQTLRNRLRRLKKSLPEDYSEIIQLIKQGAFYDELSDEQKDLYWMYHGYVGIDHKIIEECTETVVFLAEDKEVPDGYWHERLEYKQPKERKSFEEVVKEVEQLVLAAEEDLQKEMNINDVLKN
jgi:hypothetical protein